MSSPKYVGNSERGREILKSKDTLLPRLPTPKMPRGISLVSLTTVQNNPGPLWIPGSSRCLGWKTLTLSMMPNQLTAVPSLLIPKESPEHIPTLWVKRLIMEMSPESIFPMTTKVKEQPCWVALPAPGESFPAFLNFHVPQEGPKCFLIRTWMCHPTKPRWLSPHPWAHTAMWRLILFTRDKLLCAETKRGAGSLPGSPNSPTDHRASQSTAVNSAYRVSSCTWLCVEHGSYHPASFLPF